MSWVEIYRDKSLPATDPALVAEWASRLRQRGYDDKARLHPFAFADLSEDLAKDRLLFAANMGLGKTTQSIAAADVVGAKHTLIVAPKKLFAEWERDFRRLGLGFEYKVIESLADIVRFECPSCGADVHTYRRVLYTGSNVVADVRRECPTCKVPARRIDNLARFNLVSTTSLWMIPADSPHAVRGNARPEMWGKNSWGGNVKLKAARTGLKHSFAWYLRKMANLVIVDEAYSLSNSKSLQARAVYMLKPDRRILLTGTPIRGFADNILGLISWLCGNGGDMLPAYDTTREGAVRRFLDLYGTKVTKIRDDGKKVDRVLPQIQNPQRFQALLAPLMRRRVNLEPAVAQAIEMPPFDIFAESVESDDLFRELYERCVTEFVEWYKERLEEQKRTGVAPEYAAILTRLDYLSRFAAVPQSIAHEYDMLTSKQARIIELIRDANARGRKVILASEHLDSLRYYADHPLLEDSLPVVIDGSVSLQRSKRTATSQRDRRMTEFREGASTLMVASTRAIAEGLNIPEAGVVIFDSFPWSPSVHSQAWSRVLRPQQRHRPVEIYMIAMEGTVDDYKAAINAIKRAAISEGIDHEAYELDLADVPDAAFYANHLVQTRNTTGKSFDSFGWIERLKEKAAAANAAQRTA